MIKTESAGGIIVNDQGKIVVVQQQKNTWSLPKGPVETGEDLVSAAKREIYEETGLKNPDLVKNLRSYERTSIGSPDELKTINIFLFKTSETKLKPVDPVNPKALWIEKDKVADLLSHPKDKEFFLKILKEI